MCTYILGNRKFDTVSFSGFVDPNEEVRYFQDAISSYDFFFCCAYCFQHSHPWWYIPLSIYIALRYFIFLLLIIYWVFPPFFTISLVKKKKSFELETSYFSPRNYCYFSWRRILSNLTRISCFGFLWFCAVFYILYYIVLYLWSCVCSVCVFLLSISLKGIFFHCLYSSVCLFFPLFIRVQIFLYEKVFKKYPLSFVTTAAT